MKASYDKYLSHQTEDGNLLDGYLWGDLEKADEVYFCLHGLSSHALWFDKLGQILKEKQRCVMALNRRGSGGMVDGSCRMCAKNLKVLLDDLDSWLEFIGQSQRIIVVGHCWGALMANAWLERNVDARISRFIMLAPPFQTVFDRWWQPLLLKGLNFIHGKLMMTLPYGAEIFSDDPEIQNSIENDAYFQRACSVRLLKIGNDLKQLRPIKNANCKVVVILPSQDKLVVNSLIEKWCDEIIHVDSGHGLILEKTVLEGLVCSITEDSIR